MDTHTNHIASFTGLCSVLFNVPVCVIAIRDPEVNWELFAWKANSFKFEYLIKKDAIDDTILEVVDRASLEHISPYYKTNNILFYAQIPISDNGQNLGYLCLMDTVKRKLEGKEKDSLRLISIGIAEAIRSKKHIKKLEEQVVALNNSFSRASNSLAIIDEQSYNFESATDEFYQVTGLTFIAKQNSSFIELISPVDQDRVKENLKTLEEGQEVEFETSTIERPKNIIKFNALKKEGRYYIYPKDITSRRKQKQETQENEERYKRFSEFTFENIAIHEAGKIVDCNPTFTKTFGYDYADVKGMSLFHFFPRLYREIINKDSITDERRMETMCVRKDSSTFPAEIMVKTVVNDGHTINAIAIRDNTERKELENELVKSTVFQRAILDSSSFAIISIDFNGLIKTFNKGAEKMLGLKAEEVVEKMNIIELHVEEEIQNRAEELSRELNKVILPGYEVLIEKLQTLNVDEYEWTYLQKNKPGIVVSITATTLKDNFGEITGYLFISTDISDKKKAEAEIIDKSQLLNGILSHMPVFIFKVDKKGIFTQSIGTGLINLGLEKNKLVGKDIFKTFPHVSDFLEKAYAGEYVSFINSTLIQDTEFHYEYFVFPDQANKGGLIGFALNITEKINSEQQLKESADNLAKINKELDQFAYIVSHDLKAPLRGIAALSEYIEEDLGTEVDAEIQHNMTMLRGRAQRMQNLIDGILSYSRVGRIKVTRDEVHLDILVQEVISVINAPESFSLQVAKKLPVIYSNSTWLEQIFTNLISNAIKYHDKPQGKVVIDFEEDSKFYKFSVEDDGPGIAQEFHEKVFVIFQTLASRDTKESTGVGLAIVKKIIEEHGGTIWIESDGKLGSKFIFTLPKI